MHIMRTIRGFFRMFRTGKVLFPGIMLFLVLAVPARAGILSSITDAGTDVLVNAALTAAFALLATFLGAKVIKWKNIAKDGIYVLLEIRSAVAKSSDGGKVITTAELDKIIAKAQVVATDFRVLYEELVEKNTETETAAAAGS